MSENSSQDPMINPVMDGQVTEPTPPPPEVDGSGDLDYLPPPSNTEPTPPPPEVDGSGDLDYLPNPHNASLDSQPTTIPQDNDSTTTSIDAPPPLIPPETVEVDQSHVTAADADLASIPILKQESAAQPISEVAVPEKPAPPANSDPLVTGGLLGLGSLAAGFAAWRIKRKNAKK